MRMHPPAEHVLSGDQADELGRVADDLDSALHATALPLPTELHLECVTSAVRSARDTIARIVREATGTDPWKTNPLEG